MIFKCVSVRSLRLNIHIINSSLPLGLQVKVQGAEFQRCCWGGAADRRLSSWLLWLCIEPTTTTTAAVVVVVVGSLS